MTRREIAAFLKECGSDEPQSEVKVILEELFGVSAAAQMCSPDRDYDSEKLRELLTRRKAREPLQYILGYAYFCSEKYLLNDACLIPRADTELLVSKAAELLPEGAVIADLCTGSGCIAISLLSMRPDIKAVATDISERAVQAAQNNALLKKRKTAPDGSVAVKMGRKNPLRASPEGNHFVFLWLSGPGS